MSSEDVEKIKDRLNIVDVVGQYVQLKKAGKNYTARCPFHKERTPSFMVSPERGTYMCFGCGERGDVFSFVQKMEGSDFPTVLKQLAEKAGVKLETRFVGKPKDVEKEERLRAVCEAAVSFFEAELAKHSEVQKYITTRGVNAKSSKEWRLGYAPPKWEELSKHLTEHGFSKDEIVDAGFAVRSEKKQGEIFDRFRGRIIFPIFGAGNEPIAVSGRFFEKVPGQKEDVEPAKYVNSPETALFKKSRTLYGLNQARGAIRKADCILLVEGQFDLVLAHQSGLPFTVALSGTALTEEHLSILGRLSKRLVLALDADQAGLRSGLKSALMAFKTGFEVKVPSFPEGKDPADLGAENPELLKAAIRTSKTAVEFFMDALRPAAKDERAYQRMVEQSVLPLVASMHSSIEQAHFTRLVAERLHVPEAAVRAEVAKHPALPSEDAEAELVAAMPDAALAPFDKKVGMLIAYFAPHTPVYVELSKLVGESELQTLAEKLAPQQELLRFRFEQELGLHTSESQVAEDMLREISKAVEKTKFKAQYL
ncbi:DNA primase [Candidatus Adlerbacteria bacterium RIFCSPHIGHO2_12_FULL_53_18]|uniref:DNA primase n=1 Tax=Candidatus Adlerbacteria bacterium RIFCSPHIGHO2_12_FULL_53_18 TaxID=1797242 RepID=A0A1F4XS86_9BACT|nr:MAG: DNA primase [Candidatus Adlerbacteria bacterium RIFCSPHIGHO2_12_FULL_53_18]